MKELSVIIAICALLLTPAINKMLIITTGKPLRKTVYDLISIFSYAIIFLVVSYVITEVFIQISPPIVYHDIKINTQPYKRDGRMYMEAKAQFSKRLPCYGTGVTSLRDINGRTYVIDRFQGQVSPKENASIDLAYNLGSLQEQPDSLRKIPKGDYLMMVNINYVCPSFASSMLNAKDNYRIHIQFVDDTVIVLPQDIWTNGRQFQL